MKTWIYRDAGSLENLSVTERPDPEPGPHDVVLRMRAASLNYRDLAILRGDYPLGAALPLVPLSDGAGEVVKVGAEVTRVRIGQLAIPTYMPDWIDGPYHPNLGRRRLGGPTDGVLSEYMLVDEEALVAAPPHLDAREAATLPVAAVTAWHAIHEVGSLRPGETILLFGTGGVTLAALQFAKIGGARAIVVTRGARDGERLRDLGASVVIARGEEADWPADVLAATDGRGADMVLDVVGGPSLARSVAASRVGGRVHLVGFVAGTSATIDTLDAIRHGVTIQAGSTGHRRSFEALGRAMCVHGTKPVIDRVFPVAAIGDAFGRLAERGHFGKVVVEVP